ncbi:methyl-accepting chemotaxis protein [Curvibacter sp. HBC61]|uniref:Methyl-accepting chemotaxis protein n=1 Tax=Curvibacter cyanobacteriorum TaxID=3026422 RepID=A0ABT5MXT1_9BURK|nr:methyl-accepting chemotaxis protein [Curvibacter sp. HBC61]MDD0838810.1 methyl-accepting chemotaxis protein [Curvibacter sp. HBC61]
MSRIELDQVKVSTRLSLGFGLLLVCLVAVGGIALYKFSTLAGKLDELISNRLVKVTQFTELKDNFQSVARITRTVALIEDVKQAQEQADKIQPLRARSVELIGQLSKTLTVPKSVELLKVIQDNRQAYDADIDAALRLGLTGKPEDAKAATDILLLKVPARQDLIFKALDDSVAVQRELAQQAGAQASEAVASGRVLVLGLVAAAILAGVLAAYLIVRNLTRALGAEPYEVSRAVARVADGDLSQTVALRPGDTDSVMAAVQRMQASLAQVVSTVRQGSEAVASASAQIASGNRDLSGRTEEQASALEQTAASMEELGSTVTHNADNARQANQLAQAASGVASQGGAVVAEVVDTMKEINDSSRKIADIIGVIDGIAFQTNILALNAAVEAARAGEQGRGFAVVAGEVRTLAGRSAEASKEIRRLIQASVERVESGSVLVDRAGATMSEVVGSIQRVSDIMGEISAGTSEQAQGVTQIGEAVTQMDQTTQQNAALVEEMSAAADSLRVQADDLVRAVAVFKLAPGMGAASPRSAPAPRRQAVAAPAVKSPALKSAAAPALAPAASGRPAAPVKAAALPPASKSPVPAREDDWESF